jgi:nucleotide-binding universal stress UspA family protein
MDTIVLATDGSSSAAKAAGAAIELAKATGWSLHVMTAWRLPVYEWGYAPVAYVADLTEPLREHAAQIVADVVHAAEREGVEAIGEIVEGDPPSQICTVASERDAELIVIGSHGWGGLRRLVFGSVSSAVLHEAPCPVLVVRGVAAEAEPELVGAGAAASAR